MFIRIDDSWERTDTIDDVYRIIRERIGYDVEKVARRIISDFVVDEIDKYCSKCCATKE